MSELNRRRTAFPLALDARFRRPLISFFSRRTVDRAEAEDLTQEVFIRLLRSGENPNWADTSAFVFAVASNLLRDRARNRMRRLASLPVLEDQCSAISTEGTIEDRTPERVLLGREAIEVVTTALSELPDRTRESFVLFRFEGLSQKQIADLQGVTVSAVEKHIARAIAHLLERFSQS